MAENTRSPDFKNVFSNTFTITASQNELHIIFGIQHVLGSQDTAMEEQTRVVLTPATAKMASKLIEIIVGDIEKITGNTIPIDDSKIESFRQILLENRKQKFPAK